MHEVEGEMHANSWDQFQKIKPVKDQLRLDLFSEDTEEKQKKKKNIKKRRIE